MKPYRLSGPIRRVVRRTAASRLLARHYARVQQPADLLLHRATRGRLTLTSLLADVELVLLTTTGDRTGSPGSPRSSRSRTRAVWSS